MQSLRRKYSVKTLSCKLICCLAILLTIALPLSVRAKFAVDNYNSTDISLDEDFADFNDNLLILEPIIQGFNMEDYAYASTSKDKNYISLSQMANYLGLKYTNENNVITLWFADNEKQKYRINLKTKKIEETDENGKIVGESLYFKNYDLDYIDNSIFFSDAFWSRLLGAEVEIDPLNMQLKIKREKDFPAIAKLRAQKNRDKKSFKNIQKESLKNYEFDNRLFSAPVIDLSLSKGWAHNKKSHKTTNSDSYSVNMAMLAFGIDTNVYATGNSSDDKPTVRVYGTRTFLDEPENKFNVKSLKIGDISGVNQSYFTDASYGRGINVSSFKNLVMSANKTINLTGPLLPGWEVELYWNDQLIGYRQNGANGEYSFPDVPVSYGLNTFKLVFFGPMGETRTEYERYYSGTSPVKTGEFGYNVAVYQPYRYLIENNEDFSYEKNDTPIIDLTGYYGATDRVTLIGGFTQTPSSATDSTTQNFALAGTMVSLSGSSIQYNLEQNLDTSKFGHHLEWQGNVYIGNIYAGYDKYNKIHSPNSKYGNEYLDEQFEVRLSGMLPYRVPYYVSYKEGKLEDGKKPFKNMSARISKQFRQGFNLSLEDTWQTSDYNKHSYNSLRGGIYKWHNKWTLQSYLTYRTNPEPDFTEILARLDWRAGRNTYFSSQWTKNLENNMDYFSISGGHDFSFGGLTLAIETDRKFNLSATLNYNISFAKKPDSYKLMTNSNSKLSNSGTTFVRAKDENGKPLEGVGFNANGLDKIVYTDKDGVAVLADLQTYERTIVTVDEETLDDVALHPESEYKKVILRPGAIKTIDYGFTHKGAIEGKIANPNGKTLFGYQVTVFDKSGNEVTAIIADTDGYFILDGINYGTYDIVISKDGRAITQLKDIKVDDVVIYLDKEININL